MSEESRAPAGRQDEVEATATLLFDLAHDMRSPLLTLLGFTELALESKHEPEVLDRTLNAVVRSALRLNRLVEDLVNLARYQSPPPPPAPRPLVLERILAEQNREAERTWDLRGISLVLEDTGVAGTLTCDERSFRIASTALLRNAVEACPDEGTVTLRLLEDASGLRLEIENEGERLEAEAREKLGSFFEDFSSGAAKAGHPSSAEPGPGLGLGLCLARQSADILDGRIELRLREPDGALAILHLPAGDQKSAYG